MKNKAPLCLNSGDVLLKSFAHFQSLIVHPEGSWIESGGTFTGYQQCADSTGHYYNDRCENVPDADTVKADTTAHPV